MSLNLTILTGNRKNSSFVLSENPLDIPFEIIENEAVRFEYIPNKKEVYKVDLIFDDINLSFEAKYNDGELTFVLDPIRDNFGYKCLFQNYFGNAFPIIRLESNEGVQEVIELQPFDVLASKLSAQSAHQMLMYVMKNADAVLLQEICPTKKSIEFDEGGEEPKAIIEKLENTLANLEGILPHIMAKPFSKLSYSSKMVNGDLVDDFDDVSFAWLSENLSVLDLAEDMDRYHFEYDGYPYKAFEVLGSKIDENSDIYENRVIFSFLIKLKRVVVELQSLTETRELISTPSRTTLEGGYISFFDMLHNSNLNYLGVSKEKISKISLKLNFLFNQFRLQVPVTKEERAVPVITAKIKNNKSYINVFKLVNEWHRFNKINWVGSEIYLSIKNTPALFEIYCAIAIKESLKRHLSNIKYSSNQSFLEGNIAHIKVKFMYEPDFWGCGHRNADGEKYISTLLKKFNENEFKANNHKYNKRTPDYVIFIEEYDKSYLIVLDAKYSKMKNTYEKRLPECIVKYVHSLHDIEGGYSPVSSLVLISPNKELKYIDMHVPPYDLHGNKTIYPVLGVQGIKVSNDCDKQFDSLLLPLLQNAVSLLSENIEVEPFSL